MNTHYKYKRIDQKPYLVFISNASYSILQMDLITFMQLWLNDLTHKARTLTFIQIQRESERERIWNSHKIHGNIWPRHKRWHRNRINCFRKIHYHEHWSLMYARTLSPTQQLYTCFEIDLTMNANFCDWMLSIWSGPAMNNGSGS